MSDIKSLRYVSKVDSNPQFPAIEVEVLKFWMKYGLLECSTNKPHIKDFVFFDGPPFANGLPHYGHLLTGYVKDTVARMHTMLGERVTRRFGWDCHGLPAEMAAEKELGVSGKKAIEEYGVDKFNSHCARSVMRYTNEWQKYVIRQARWVSFDDEYKTMDLSYMESVIWAFKQLYDKGLVYQDFRVMPYSWACETPLSNFEIRLDDSYREKTSKTVVVSFKLATAPISLRDKEVRLLAWTTTPWTLPSNLALAVNSNIEYQSMVIGNICYVAADLAPFFKDIYKLHGIHHDNYEIYKTVAGSEFIGLDYEPLFSYFQDWPNAFRVLDGSHFVTADDGTGVVHMAPGFGEDDFNLCKKEGIEVVCPITSGAMFTSEISDFAGMFVFDANDHIIMKLKASGHWIKTDQYQHNYPHCWRTDTPLIYRAMPSWYLAVSSFSSRMVDLSHDINWIPFHSKEQFTNWLANATDWSISRNRFFGTPIPIWQSDDPQYPRIDAYGSIAELERDFGVKVMDLHRPFIDELVRPNPDDPTGKSMMRRVPEVLDCWFESGSMSFAADHYPFNTVTHNGKFGVDFDSTVHPPIRLPADFIVEYVAQIRGWFYTLMVMSTALFDKIPFKNAICHGVVLDADGKKLSKRLNNYIDPCVVMDIYGSDALRFLMLSSPVMSGGALFIDKEQRLIADVVRLHIKPVWNAYAFLVLYANVDKVRMDEWQPTVTGFDRYIYVKMCDTVKQIRSSLESYKIDGAYKALAAFFDVLNNWYIRRNKPRFWEQCDDKQDAYNLLYTVLNTVAVAMAPLLPLLAEAIYSGLNHRGLYIDANQSVHMQRFPEPSFTPMISDAALVKDMEFTQEICNAALAVRNRNKVRVRQPLSRLIVAGERSLSADFIRIIQDEVNIKEVFFDRNVTQYCTVRPKVNFAAVAKRIPEAVKRILNNLSNWQYMGGGQVSFGQDILLEDEVVIAAQPLSKASSEVLQDNLTVVILELHITDGLWGEGVARDVVRSIQTARQSSMEITDRIITYLQIEDENISKACEKWRHYIMEQTLSVELRFATIPNDMVVLRFDVEDKPVMLGIAKCS